jgi:hypothetical protein
MLSGSLLPEESGVVMPIEEFAAGAIIRSRRQPKLSSLHGEVLLAVLELASQASAGSELIIGRYREVAAVEQCMDVRSKKQTIRDQVPTSLTDWLDVSRL